MNEMTKVKWFERDIEIYDERRVVSRTTSTITLNYIPSATRPLLIANGKTQLEEVSSNPSVNQFVADRENGILLFNSSMNGKVMTINYNAIGVFYLSADKIYTNADTKGNVVQTLEDLIKDNYKIIKSVETVGDGASVITQLRKDIDSITPLAPYIIDAKGFNEELINNANVANSVNMASKETVNKMNEWVSQHSDIVDLDTKVEENALNINKVNDAKEDKLIELVENYESVITNTKIKDYSYSQLSTDISAIVTKYKDKVSAEVIGASALGREIKALILGNKNGANKLLVFSGHHAREQHMASLILKQIEYYCENWNGKLNGEKLSDVFKNSAIFFIPSINPDGMELCRIGLDSIPVNDTTRINNIKSALEWKIRNDLTLNSDVNSSWDLYSQISWSGEKGKLPSYTFRNQDLTMWKSNANGVDLHYNSWESNVNEAEIKAWSVSQGWRDTFASENYIGLVGMGEPENIALRGFIDKYNLKRYSLSYHGKGPTVFWNYKLTGKQAQRNHTITKELSQMSNTVYSETNNSRIGFSGYMYAKGDNLTYCATRETGWGNERINPDNNYCDVSSPYTVCPLPDNQLPWTWQAEKNIPLYMLAKYCRRQDLKERHIYITEFDKVHNSYNSDNDYVIIDYSTGIIEQGGVINIPFTGQTEQSMEIILREPFKVRNRGGYANCTNTSSSILSKITNIGITKDQLTKVVVTVNSSVAMGSVESPYSVGINWFVKGI